MTERDDAPEGKVEGEAGTGEGRGGREAPGARREEPGPVPEPSPEEAPELLGECSDYPIAWDPTRGES